MVIPTMSRGSAAKPSSAAGAGLQWAPSGTVLCPDPTSGFSAGRSHVLPPPEPW